MTDGQLTPEEVRTMSALAEALVQEVEPAGRQLGLDGITTALALSFAATKLLYRISANPELALKAVNIMNVSALQSMADMIAGADAPNQRRQ
ncbi:MAG: hypothetical protein J0H88_16455 [Sphingomonadales bacterium]|nr:hypothetical protein [Sphingomonadales bacterium]